MKGYVRGGRAVLTSDNSKLRPWRDAVTWAARDALGVHREWVRDAGPMECDVTFWLPRPKSAPRTRDILPTKGLDGDKLQRGVFDALTNAGAWVDDSQVVLGIWRKFYCVGPELPKIYDAEVHRAEPGATIIVRKAAYDAHPQRRRTG